MDVVFGKAAGKLFGRSPLLAIINPAISDAQMRVLSLMAVPGVSSAVASTADIASVMGWSERKVKYCVAALVNIGALEVSRRPNQPNAYRIKSEVFTEIPRESRTVRLMKQKPQLGACMKCSTLCARNKAGWCRKCAGRIELTGFVRREINGAFAERGMGLQEKLSDHKTA